MAKRKKRKKWPAYKYWTEFLRQEDIWIGEYRTINHSLATILMERDGKNHSKEKIDKFAEYLAAGRNKAVCMLWDSGKEVYVLGKGRIEAITCNPDDKEEHLSRIGQMLDQKNIATGRKSRNATESQCKQFGLPRFKQISQSRARLLLGDSEFHVHITQLA